MFNKEQRLERINKRHYDTDGIDTEMLEVVVSLPDERQTYLYYSLSQATDDLTI